MMTLFLSTLWQEVINHLPTGLGWFALIEGKDTDIMYQIQNGFDVFIKTGRAWALVIGFVLGYVFKGFTSY
jgi:hypothetical protein